MGKRLELKKIYRDFPGGPGAKTPCSQCRGPCWTPGQGTRTQMPHLKIPAAAAKTWCSHINKYTQRRYTDVK